MCGFSERACFATRFAGITALLPTRFVVGITALLPTRFVVGITALLPTRRNESFLNTCMPRVSLLLAVGRAAAFARPRLSGLRKPMDCLTACFGGGGGGADDPYGSWPSPITAKFITGSSVGLGSLKVDGSGLYWLESRPQEGGRNVVVRYAPDDPQASERGGVDVTLKESNVRTRVHEYGGGAFSLHTGGGLLFSDFASQRLNLALGDGAATVVTDTAPDGQFRYADYDVAGDGGSVLCVREDHGPDGKAKPVDVVNQVVLINLSTGDEKVVASGRDFYAAPKLAPDGKSVAYVTWDHPNMPWDATELRMTTMKSTSTDKHELVSGDGDSSVLQPAFHPSGALFYLTDEQGFYALQRYEKGASTTVLAVDDADLGGSAPGWALGQQGYTFLSDGRVAAAYPDRKTGQTAVAILKEDGSAKVVHSGAASGLPHSVGGLTPGLEGEIYMVGGGPAVPAGIYKWDFTTSTLLASSSSAAIDATYISKPQPISFPTTLGEAYGFYYPPRHPTCSSSEKAPPLLVKAHGGPTACTGATFNPKIQYWTSRGFAVLDVDYGGSTGYGREYRRRLRGAWGIVDIDDVCAGAQHLVKQGLADAKRLAIDGGSAGGYTTLGALAFRDVFTAGCSLYGVADLSALASDTHKFESRYLDGLVGKYPEDEAIYTERAPINSVETLDCPILLLQGDEDKIVPPNQAELMHAALLEKKVPTALKIYKGEQHGFRKSENIEDALNSELYFFSKVFGFDVSADRDIVPFPIDNL